MENIGNKTQPEKASLRVSINSTMTGVLFFMITIIWTLNPQKFSFFILSQLVLAIPLLYSSIIAYSKLAYWDNNKQWEAFAWWTNTTGNIFILNVVGLMTATVSPFLAYIYFVLNLILTSIHYALKYHYSSRSITKNRIILRYIFWIIILCFGGILPLVLKLY